jgi:sensor domain CHASE-containing protein
METLTVEFVQGMFAVVSVLAVAGVVWMMVNMNRLKERLAVTSKELEDLERSLHLRVDDENREVEKLVDSVYRDIDSRLDKFEHRISKNSPTITPL